MEYDAYHCDELFGSRNAKTKERWEKNGNSTEVDACVICGRKTGANPASVHVVYGGGAILAVEDEKRYGMNQKDGSTCDRGDMGFWSIGSECAKKIPSKYVHRLPEGA